MSAASKYSQANENFGIHIFFPLINYISEINQRWAENGNKRRDKKTLDLIIYKVGKLLNNQEAPMSPHTHTQS